MRSASWEVSIVEAVSGFEGKFCQGEGVRKGNGHVC